MSKAYLASGWFNPVQEADLAAMKAHCGNYYSPRDELLCPSDASANFAQHVLLSNIEAIASCDYVYANLRHRDLGVSFELGVAHALKVPIQYYGETDEQLAADISVAKAALAALPELPSGVVQLPSGVYVVSTEAKAVDNVAVAGWLHTMRHRVVYYCPSLPAGAPFNLMLAATADAVCSSWQDLLAVTVAAEPRPYVGAIE